MSIFHLKDGEVWWKQGPRNQKFSVWVGRDEALSQEMLFLLAKPESGAGRLRCLAGRFFLRSERAESWCTAARWAPGGRAADGLVPTQHVSFCLPTSANQKGKRGECQNLKKIQQREEWSQNELLHFNDCSLNALALDFDARYDGSMQIPRWDVRLTLPSSFKIKKLNRQHMFPCRKQQVNTVLSILPGPFVLLRSPRAIFVDVYTWHAFTGFNMSERCVYVCVCVILVNVFAAV